MNRFPRRDFGRIVSWLVFPLVPVILEDMYHRTCNFKDLLSSAPIGPDPRQWDWLTWIVMLGPLVGYGFLAGATLDIGDVSESSRGSLARVLAKRSIWVAFGPWLGFLGLCGLYFAVTWSGDTILRHALPPTDPNSTPPWWWGPSPGALLLRQVLFGLFVAVLGYSWIWIAHLALRRAAAIGQLGRVFFVGSLTAITFVGTLFGSFWAATAVWRSYFFDPRIVPLVAVGVSLVILGGCGTPITYGEMRRRETFHAMLLAWTIGLALWWRWCSRQRPRGDRGS